MNFTELADQLLGSSGGGGAGSGGIESSPLMMLVWVLPIILFVFYGQRIQLYVTSGEIKKAIKKLDAYRTESRDALLAHVREVAGSADGQEARISRFIDYFTIMPVDTDPSGIMPRIKHVVRTREDVTRRQVRALSDGGMDGIQEARIQTMLEIAASLHMIHKTVSHMFLTAKKQNNYPLILPLQMVLPFVMEQAEAMRDSVPAFERGLPIGDGIGPMVVGRMMRGLATEEPALHTTSARCDFEGRGLILVKATGPASVVGRPADALCGIAESGQEVHAIVMVDAALKMEGEESATISHGFGAAIGGIGTERYAIEKYAAENDIPVFSIVLKESVREAIAAMSAEISERADEIRARVYETIRESTERGQTVMVIGVGNTAGVAQ